MTWEQTMLMETASKIDGIVETLLELRDWAEEEGYSAIAHKVEEAAGPLSSAGMAAEQYAAGELTRRSR